MSVKVSVIIPTYKRPAFICRAINSVLNQTYSNIEVIVVDDNDENSEDRKKMEEIMEQYKNNKKVIYLKHKKNKNGAAARNTGILQAKGDYITFLDDDDYFLKNRIKNILQKISEKGKKADLYYTGVIVIENNKIKKIVRNTKSGNLQKDILSQKSFFATGSNLFFSKKSLVDINGFDESFFRHQDLEVLVRYFSKYEVDYIEDFSVVKIEEDRSNVPNIDKMIEYRIKFLETFQKQINNFEKDEIKKIYTDNYYNLLVYLVRNRQLRNINKLDYFKKKYSPNLTFQKRIKLVLEIFDLYFPISKIYRFIRLKRTIKLLPDKTLIELKESEQYDR